MYVSLYSGLHSRREGEGRKVRTPRAWKFRYFSSQRVHARLLARRERGSKNSPRYKSIRGASESKCRSTNQRAEEAVLERNVLRHRACRQVYHRVGRDRGRVEWGERGGHGWMTARGGGGSVGLQYEESARTQATMHVASGHPMGRGGRPCAAPRLPRLRDLSRTLVNYA